MVDVVFKDSVFRYTDPIRFFKVNDPYFYQVDNIPLKQLQENDNWLKDQISNIEVSKVKRKDIDELRPYVLGGDNVVKVSPGRYTARINDAYGLTRLQNLSRLLGGLIGEIDTWQGITMNDTLSDPVIFDIIGRFREEFKASTALGMNGLIERAFTYPIKDSDLPAIDWLAAGKPTTKDVEGLNRPVFPISEALLWANALPPNVKTNYVLKSYNLANTAQGFLQLANTENHFIKLWRGVARTAVVDVPEELEIEIPRFDPEDYFWISETGEKVLLGADNRIDLLFIYSKPIDTSAVTVAKYVNNVPTKINKPVLGILKGAGLGVDFTWLNDVTKQYNPVTAIEVDGVSKMLPNIADQKNPDMGFRTLGVHGSFPAPDDLLNLAPTLSEDLESDNYLLLGQTILPIAYIVVKRESQVTANGVPILREEDVIDIRPFFRTTELAYNERAGIAAAMPALSLANPAVGKAQMDWEVARVYNDMVAKFDELRRQEQNVPRPVAIGYIMGGLKFGVEATLLHWLETKYPGATREQRIRQLVVEMGLPTDTGFSELPDWDLSKWVQVGTWGEKGLHPNDYINVHVETNTPAQFACEGNIDGTVRIAGFGTDNINGKQNIAVIHYCKKTVLFDKSHIPWMKDYQVRANFMNCVPLTAKASSRNAENAAGAGNIWIQKKEDSFTIFCAWTAHDFYPLGNSGGSKQKILNHPPGGDGTFPDYNRDGGAFAGFAVLTTDLMNEQPPTGSENYGGEPAGGVAIYPSVQFEVIGIPHTYASYFDSRSMNVNNPVITLS